MIIIIILHYCNSYLSLKIRSPGQEEKQSSLQERESIPWSLAVT